MATNAAPILQGVGQIAVPVRDVERATRFYRDVLGLRYLFSAPPGLAFFMSGAVRLMLAAPEDEMQAKHASVIYHTVSDISHAHRALEERGATFTNPPHVIHRTDTYELWMAFLQDSEGNLVGLMEERAIGG